MDTQNALELLYEYASGSQFEAFETLFAQAEPNLPGDALREARLMRVQLKLFSGDASALDDLPPEDVSGAKSEHPCLFHHWIPDSPNTFILFTKSPGGLRRFLNVLPGVQACLGRWYGVAGESMARQLRSEILYYVGEFGDAQALAQAQAEAVQDNPAWALMADYVLFRCALAQGRAREAEEYMLDMVRISRGAPQCAGAYQSARGWANLTTGWSGDTPRFSRTPEGEALPVLDDRLAAIQNGIAAVTPGEAPFVAFARKSNPDTYTMRQFYMDVFHSIYWFQAGDLPQVDTHFRRMHAIAVDSGLLMPLAECGRQILPLLEHIRAGGFPCEGAWLDRVCALAEQYEEGLTLYRK